MREKETQETGDVRERKKRRGVGKPQGGEGGREGGRKATVGHQLWWVWRKNWLVRLFEQGCSSKWCPLRSWFLLPALLELVRRTGCHLGSI